MYFATAPTSQKGVNLSTQDYGVLQVGDGDDVIIIEGQTRLVTDPTERQVVAEQYGKKYVEPVTGERAAIDWPGAALYRLDANKVMAWIYGNVAARTDWRWTS